MSDNLTLDITTNKPNSLPLYLKQKCNHWLAYLPNLEATIQERRCELLSSTGPEDENIGGGRSSFVSQPTESLVLKLLNDPVLVQLEGVGAVFNRLVGIYSQDTETFLKGLYLTNKSMSELSKSIGVSVRTLERWNKRFLIDFAWEMGWCDEQETNETL